MTFYDRCEMLANEKKIPFSEIASQAGVTGSAITSWKKNDSFPKADVAVKVAKCLNTSVEYLVTGKEGDADLSPEEMEVVQIFRSIPETFKIMTRDVLLDIAKDR